MSGNKNEKDLRGYWREASAILWAQRVFLFVYVRIVSTFYFFQQVLLFSFLKGSRTRGNFQVFDGLGESGGFSGISGGNPSQ